MTYLTFVTPKPEKDFDLWIKNSNPQIKIEDRTVFDTRAVRWRVKAPLDKAQIDLIRQAFKVDVFQTETNDTPIKLFLADMDSTIIDGETLDDMAALAGIGDQVANITARAMAGEIDFEGALRERVALLKGHSSQIIDTALAAMILNKGAEPLLTHLKNKGVTCILVSGGFTQFTGKVAQDLGFDDHFGNRLIVEDDVLTGAVGSPILDKNFKAEKLQELQNVMNLKPAEIMAVGDGANDLPMLQAAGIGVAYHGKPILQKTLINQITMTDLSSLKYLV